jgi:hypothetical protein
MNLTPQLFKKFIIEAYIAGAETMTCGCLPPPTKTEAREWFDDQFGLGQVEECECCEDKDDGDS